MAKKEVCDQQKTKHKAEKAKRKAVVELLRMKRMDPASLRKRDLDYETLNGFFSMLEDVPMPSVARLLEKGKWEVQQALNTKLEEAIRAKYALEDKIRLLETANSEFTKFYYAHIVESYDIESSD